MYKPKYYSRYLKKLERREEQKTEISVQVSRPTTDQMWQLNRMMNYATASTNPVLDYMQRGNTCNHGFNQQ